MDLITQKCPREREDERKREVERGAERHGRRGGGLRERWEGDV